MTRETPFLGRLFALFNGYGADRTALLISAACLLHCIVGVTLAVLLIPVSALATNPVLHFAGFVIALPLALYALGKGALSHGEYVPLSIGSLGIGVMLGALSLPHGLGETLFTMVGVAVLAVGHWRNMAALHVRHG